MFTSFEESQTRTFVPLSLIYSNWTYPFSRFHTVPVV